MAAVAFAVGFIVVVGTPAVSAQTVDKVAAEKYNEGLGHLKEKNYESALNTFLEAMEIAEAAGDKQIASKAKNYAYRLYYNVGLGYKKAGQLDTALQHFQKGVEMEPTYHKNYMGVAKIHHEKGDAAAAIEAYIKAAGIASEAGELEERSKALTQAEGFVAREMQEEDFQGVVERGNLFLQFSETPMVHFYLAHAYNKLGQHQEALAHADKALELDQGSRASKAKIHFEKAEAYRNIGQTDQALQAYAEAAYGEFKQRAQYMIDELSGSN